MPVLRRSITESHAHKDVSHPPPMEVYLATSTGEYFSSYEEYVERVALYSQPVWTCKLTGHTGLTYPDALQSEEAARRSLELFPEWWKPYSLSAIHCSTESIDMLATRIGNYCRDHLALNEPVRLTFNDVMYEGIVSVAPKFDDETSTRPSSLDAAPYRIAINDGEMIMTGACKGPEDVQRLHWPPSKALIKKYIRSTAVRYGHAGMPWLLHDDLLARYRIEKHLDPEMAERVRRIRMLKRANMERLTKEQQQQQHTSMITDKQEDSLKYPVLDEFVPADKQTDIELWPIPKSFDSSLSVIRDELMTEVLELWHFLHAFGHTLEVAPMCLHVFISSLEHEGEENPVMDALVGAFRDEFTRTVRSARVREERTEQYLGTCAPSDLPPFARPPLSPHLSIPDESDLEAFVEASLRKDPRHWSSQMLELLWDLRSIPEVRLSILTMKEKRKKIFELDGACKLRILLILRNFYLSCVSLRPTVDKEIEIAADAKHKIRELEAIRKKLAKENQDLSSQQDELNQQLEDENSKVETIKELKKALRSLDAKLSRSLKAEERLNHDIVVQRNKQFEHSAVRVRALGEDRSWRRYWWMDVHLVRPSQRAQSSGLLLVEIPKGGDNGGSDWAYYDTLEQLDALLGFLNPLGCREARLGATITQHKEQIAKILSPFPINETPSPPSDEEMPTMVRRRSAAKRRAEELPEYLRYRNTLKSGKKCNK